MLRWRAEGVRVVVRPSGTEPKLKAYLEVVGDPAGLDALRAELTPRLRPDRGGPARPAGLIQGQRPRPGGRGPQPQITAPNWRSPASPSPGTM